MQATAAKTPVHLPELPRPPSVPRGLESLHAQVKIVCGPARSAKFATPSSVHYKYKTARASDTPTIHTRSCGCDG